MLGELLPVVFYQKRRRTATARATRKKIAASPGVDFRSAPQKFFFGNIPRIFFQID
jgi:hypothetical protein